MPEQFTRISVNSTENPSVIEYLGESLCSLIATINVMQKVNIPDALYRQIESAAGDGELDDAMWEMVHTYQRKNDPAE